MKTILALLLMTSVCCADEVPLQQALDKHQGEIEYLQNEIKDLQSHVDILAKAVQNLQYQIDILAIKNKK